VVMMYIFQGQFFYPVANSMELRERAVNSMPYAFAERATASQKLSLGVNELYSYGMRKINQLEVLPPSGDVSRPS